MEKTRSRKSIVKEKAKSLLLQYGLWRRSKRFSFKKTSYLTTETTEAAKKL
jgi:hypothetical protein